MDRDESSILAEQIRHYRARASEYDEWFLRLGRYDRGEEHKLLWLDEVATVEAALAEAGPSGSILELACGTGLWTVHLAPKATELVCVDASPEVIAINKARVGDPKVRYVEADLFQWEPTATYDFIFFGFWLSHVPEAQFEPFWGKVRSALRPSGRVFLVDSRAMPQMGAIDQPNGAGETVERRLNDGRTFRVVKIFHDPAQLADRLEKFGWEASMRQTRQFFIYGTAKK